MAKFSTVRARKRFELGESGQEVLYPLPYREYVAVLTQAGTAAPTGVVLKNNLLDAGTAVALTRSGTGVYVLTLAAAFTAVKTVISLTVETAATAVLARATHTSANVVTITTATEAGVAADLVGKLNVLIRVYS